MFSSDEYDLVLDFNHLDGYGWTFNTGYNCTFNTGSNCTFKTGSYCTFNTGHDCTFDTGFGCTFSLYNVNSCTFKYNDEGKLDNGIILDNMDNKHCVLNRDFVRLQKVTNG